MEKWLIFYDIMWYNYPSNKNYFSINPELLEWVNFDIKNEKKLSSNTEKQEKILNKYWFLYRQIPFVDSIYICNSLSFKSIHENSDIDLFIVTKNNRIFLSKLFVWIFFKIFWMYWAHQKDKFCIWFYVTKDNQDLYPISIFPLDLYLAYWIAHLQPLYSENGNFDIYKENIWVKEIIPNYNMTYQKILKNNIFTGKWIIKKLLETIFWWNLLNNLLGIVWKNRMNKQKRKLWKKWKNIIISNNILKFQAPDIRKIVYLKYKMLKNPNQKENKNKKTKVIEKSLF